MKYYIRILSELDDNNCIVDHAITDSYEKAVKWCKDKKYMTKRGKIEFFDAYQWSKYAIHTTKWIHWNSKYIVNIYEIKEV